MVVVDAEAPSDSRIAADARAPSSAEARHNTDLYVRTSWVDASLALSELEKGRVDGSRGALWARAWLQSQLFALGCALHADAGKLLFVALLVLSTFCVGLKSAQLHSRVDQLWVQEGGRLEAELKYTAKVLGEPESSTHQLIIQTGKDPDASLLHAGALLQHLNVVYAATRVTIHMYDIEWRLKDLCYSPSIPDFEAYHIEKIFDNIIPCAIITPLDCFWEGSKLLGPDYPIFVPGLQHKLQWTHLNPQAILEEVKKLKFQFPQSTIKAYMKRAGITSAYMKKPCLDPTDAHCPDSAPNKKNGLIPDVASELSNGCYGFAASYMHWPRQLMVGGEADSSGRGAKALQSVVQLMGEREMYEYWADNYKVHHVGWSQEKAAAVLDAWQRKFAAEVRRIQQTDSVSPSYNFYPFSTASLNDILGKYSELSMRNIIIGYMCLLIYVAVALTKWKDPIRSQAGVGIAGVILLSMSVAAGLGFCALLGISFNASTTQIVPFLALGLGIQDIFLLTHTYVEQSGDVPREERTGLVLKKSGLNVLVASLCNVTAFLAAALLPIPALRVFCLQAAILLVFNLASVLLVFPAMISLDLRRRSAARADILCCLMPESPLPLRARKPERLRPIGRTGKVSRRDSSKEPLDPDELGVGSKSDCCLSLSLTKWAKEHYAPFIMRPAVKGISMLLLIFTILASIWGATKLRDGLDLTDIVPKNTDAFEFLYRQEKYFGFYNMYAVTQGDFEYPTNQKLLYEYHDQFVRIPNIIKNDNGGLTKFWLSLFRDWLLDLQYAFDREVASGCISQEYWCKNASDEGILAYKLMVQTGHVDNPIDKSLVSSDTKNGHRLVDKDGIINPKAFYNYLSAWTTNDALAYGASQGNLKPQPKRWTHSPGDVDLKIPKSSPLIYTQLPFYLSGLTDTESIKSLITSVRELCEKFEAKGLSNFPSGIPFLFWEQYLYLRPTLLLALVCALAAVFVGVMVVVLNVRAGVLTACAVGALALQLAGGMAALGVRLSAAPAVLLVAALGRGVHYTVHIALAFMTTIGCRRRRAIVATAYSLAPVWHGGAAAALSAALLATSHFAFVGGMFLKLLLATVVLGLVDGLLFFPIVLSILGPAAEVRPIEHPDRLSTPSPQGSPIRVRRSSERASRPRPCPRPSAPSLTTITEEPPSWHSSPSVQSSLQSIVVQPELVVETMTYNGSDSASGRSTPTSKSSPHPGTITTKVTATANIKVEVVTPGDRKPRRTYHYYERRRERDEDRDRERDRERSRDRDRDRDRDCDRDRDRDRDRGRERDRRDRCREEREPRVSPRENGRDSGHESDSSRHGQ